MKDEKELNQSEQRTLIISMSSPEYWSPSGSYNTMIAYIDPNLPDFVACRTYSLLRGSHKINSCRLIVK